MIAKAVGTIDGDIIRLDQPLDLPNASRVEVTISPIDARHRQRNDVRIRQGRESV